MGYVPEKTILERYARLTVECGLRDGKGIEPGETVIVYGQEDTKPLYYEVCAEIWRRGGNVIHNFRPEDEEPYNFSATYYRLASDAQLTHFPEAYTRGLIDQADHIIFLLGDRHPTAAKDVDPAKKATEAPTAEKYWAIRNPKERAGKLHWTIVLWGTEALAAEAGISLEEYWAQIRAACHLDDPDPVARWKETTAKIERYRDWLNGLNIDRLHVEAPGTDLWLTLGRQRKWLGGGGANIPSFEIFTSPDWRGTQGKITFTEPLYYQGALIKGVRLEFTDGLVSAAHAEEGAEQLAAMVAMPGGNRVGEYSLTDARLSNITRFMADTLYDENVGGPYGNTHLAIGLSLTECFTGDEASVSDAEWEALGFNHTAAIHCDIVATSDRTVTATLADGTERVIYAGGRFTLGDGE
ncbi:aminopeptidase [Conexibacter sp. DBS9H8]|uniref:aminopeptidase n=1 Tax=Conexibacter sp. DBS9H8 TaxID=2937801 RepID=UPI00200E2864|nr:aminopeptidase [Conexibacter sp. DBS9H8]